MRDALLINKKGEEEKKVMSNKLVKNNKIDWIIHAVHGDVRSKKPVDIHTHGLERHGIRNICMECPNDMKIIKYCGNFVNHLAMSMINGEVFEVGRVHSFDNEYDINDILDVFEVSIERRDNGEGEEEVCVVDYWFDKIYINDYNNSYYVFDKDKMKWKILSKEEYKSIPQEVRYEKIKRYDELSFLHELDYLSKLAKQKKR